MDASKPPSQPIALSHQAAKASWASAVIVFFLLMFGNRTGAKVAVELIALVLLVAGFILGVVALFGIRKHGTRGILAPALLGILINGLLLFVFVTNFLAARARVQPAATPTVSAFVQGSHRSPQTI
jgi:hypothetical protein